MNDIRIMLKKIHSDAIIPEYQIEGDAGCDLFSVEDVFIDPGDMKSVGTGIAIELPEKNIEAQIRSRSGLAKNNRVCVLNSPGTIDSTYRGEISILLINLGKEKFMVKKGDRIAQMVFAHVYRGHFLEVKELTNSERGAGGFGHTGI